MYVKSETSAGRRRQELNIGTSNFIKSKKMRKSHTHLSVSLSGGIDFLSARNQIYLNRG